MINNTESNKIKSLLAFLSCPISGGDLIFDEKRYVLYSEKAKVSYPIVDGIPILLIETIIRD